MTAPLPLLLPSCAPVGPRSRSLCPTEGRLSYEHSREEVKESEVAGGEGRLSGCDGLGRESSAVVEHRALGRRKLSGGTVLETSAFEGYRITMVWVKSSTPSAISVDSLPPSWLRSTYRLSVDSAT
jgi:hypothetical protein